MKRESVKKQGPLTYYGGKKRLVNQILPLIPNHRIYCEPYFGGGAVFFAKKPSYLEVINDINDNLINFYKMCQTNYSELSTMIKRAIYSESEYKWARQVYHGQKQVDDIEKAYATFIVFNMSINSCPENLWSFDNGTGGSHSGILFAHKRDSFCPWLKERLRYVQISCRQAIKVIKERDTNETFFYLDPPYPNSNQGHYKGFTVDDLEQLLIQLEGIKGKFLLSNYPAEIICKYAKKNNWQLKDFYVKKDIYNRCIPGIKKREIFLANYQTEKYIQTTIF